MSVWFCLASGPSQCQEDIDAVRGHGTVVAINNQLLAAPWADILFSCDSSWWEHYSDPAKEPEFALALRTFQGEKLSSDAKAKKCGAMFIPREDGIGLGRKAIRTGSNSGYQVINLAWMRGARTIVLLGYDMGWTPEGKRHNHKDHPAPLGNFGLPDMCARAFPPLANDLKAEGVRIINCSRRTALRCFERMSLSQALATI